MPRVERKEIEPLTPDEISAFLGQIGGDRLEALYVLALTTGLRRGELLGLRWMDIDLDRGSLRVVRSLQRVSGRTAFVEPKSTRSRRVVGFAPFVGEVLRVHRARQVAERLASAEEWDDPELVFTTDSGKPLDGMNLTHRFQLLLKRAGVRRRRFHDLRHSCATVLLAQGVPARVVMEMLGHSQISVTMNTYTHVLPALQQEAAARMGAFVQAASAPRAKIESK